jgi:Uma2 family endonuclease
MDPTTDRLPTGPLTYEDYVELPNDGKRYEILDGELFVTPAPVPLHQRVSRNLLRILDRQVDRLGLGEILYSPIDLILDTTTIAQPDLLFIRAGRESIVTGRAVEGAPDLVIEVLSPSSRRQDTKTKAMLYARFGILHYWIVDPKARSMELYDLAGKEYRLVTRESGSSVLQSAVFPGLEIDLGKVWA